MDRPSSPSLPAALLLPAGAVDPEEVLCRVATPADSQILGELFVRTFAAHGGGARSPASWAWRFGAAPAGNESCLALDPASGRALGHIGGTPHATLWHGVQRRTVECVDHMIDPGFRHGPGRVNVFARLTRYWFETFCAPQTSFLGWGFPSRALHRVGRRFAGYHLVRSVSVAHHDDPSALLVEPVGLDVQRLVALDDEVDALWQCCAAELPASVVRDRAHLQWRYLDCPHQQYTVLAARDVGSASLRGLIVLRDGGLVPDLVTVMDLLVPLADDDARAALLAAAAAQARAAGRAGLVAHAPTSEPHAARLSRSGFVTRSCDRILTARSWDPAVSLDEVGRQFELSFGDMDTL